MVITSDETQIQLFADWSMSYAKRVFLNNKQNPEYHIVVYMQDKPKEHIEYTTGALLPSQ